ncbi:MAG: Rpn family recombination-promoting nuclease/putative transposase [Bacteroidales bacterium]|nr:Rpn family recombination-promoting nuclease/putative transposase [Bacteroidales bacterium]
MAKNNVSPKGRLIEIDGVKFQLIDGKLFRYADMTMDKGFKIVLGRIGSEELLMHLLNRLLDIRIIHLEYRNTEHPGMTEEERESRFDVYCEDESGRAFEVEMQNWSQKYFNKRAVYYSSLVVLDQASKAQREAKSRQKDWDYNFKPLYVVCFLNFDNWIRPADEDEKYVSAYKYIDIENGNELGDGTNLVFINLYDFKKKIEECGSLEEVWLYSIKNMLKLTECPEQVKGTEVEELFFRAELAKMTLKQRIIVEEDIMTRNDILNHIAEVTAEAKSIAMAEGRAQGIEQGIAEGRAEGRAEGKAEIIQRFLTGGMTLEDIASVTGLSLEELKEMIR